MPRPELERLQLDRLRERFGVGSFEELAAAHRSRRRRSCATRTRSGCCACRSSECVRVHASSGTRGKPTIVGYTRGDIDAVGRAAAPARVAAAGGAPGTSSTTPTATACSPAGSACTTAPSGSAAPSSRRRAATRRGRCSCSQRPRRRILCCTPSLRAAHRRRGASGHRPARASAGGGIFGAEPWTRRHARGRSRTRLGIQALDIYGLSEIIGPGVAGRVQRGGRRRARATRTTSSSRSSTRRRASRCRTARSASSCSRR